MNDTEHAIAVLDCIDEHADRRQVVDFRQRLVIPLHLAVYAVKMLGPAIDLCFDMCLVELLPYLLDALVDEGLAFFALLLHILDEVIIRLRLEIAQAQVLELPLDIRDAEPVGQRRIDLYRLSRDALLLVRAHVLECAHVVQTVRQLDHDDADVFGHGQEHLAIVLELHLFLRLVLDAAELRHAIDEHGDLLAEQLLHLLAGVRRILDHIMQQCRRDRRLIHMELCQYLSDMQRMDDIGFTGNALLILVRLFCDLISPLYESDIGMGLV